MTVLGPHPIVDFDGTITFLPINWKALRSRLGLASIDDLWEESSAESWALVTNAEVEAAAVASPIEAAQADLERTDKFAVITNNSEAAIAIFMERYPGLKERLQLVVGRESLGGPKTDPARFAAAFEKARESLGLQPTSTIYCGDQDYELQLAASLGAGVIRMEPSGKLVRFRATRASPAAGKGRRDPDLRG